MLNAKSVETHMRAWHAAMQTRVTVLTGCIQSAALGMDVSAEQIENAQEQLLELIEDAETEIQWAIDNAKG